MHDNSHAFAVVDTVVVDVPDPPLPRRPRTITDGALTMQVLIEGKHHRRLPDLSMTACGEKIDTQRAPLRRESLTGPLCPDCFTPLELRISAEHAERQFTNGAKP